MSEPRGSAGDSQSIPELLLFLQDAASTGRLRVERDGASRSLYLKRGIVVGAEASARDDSLEWLLFTNGVLSEDRYGRVRSLIDAGGRRGQALVESGGLSPSALCGWTERWIRFLASDLLGWKAGRCGFEEGALPPPGSIPVALAPREVMLEGLRRGRPLPPPPSATVPVPAGAAAPGGRLEPEEDYVLGLADGKRTVGAICQVSEFGGAETLAILSRLASCGLVSMGEPSRRAPAAGRAAASGPAGSVDSDAGEHDRPGPEELGLPEGDEPADVRATVRIYNDVYVHVAAAMFREIGPIAEQLLEKALQETRAAHATLFHRINGHKEGALPEETIIRNLHLIRDTPPRDALIGALDDYLVSMLLAVRRILGPDHERKLANQIRDLRHSSA